MGLGILRMASFQWNSLVTDSKQYVIISGRVYILPAFLTIGDNK